jgi:soluble lytic murein transglycosylase-like protein
MRSPLGPCIALGLALLAASPAVAGDVKLTVGANGRKVILNESSGQRATRLSTHLVAPPDADLQPVIARHADTHQLDPRLVQAVIQVESGYNAQAVSRVGAMGLMQLMPATARDLAVADAYDPDENVRGGTAYLRRMLDRFRGSLELAVAAYNAGPEAVERYRGIPPYRETRDYVRRVLALYSGTDALALPALTLGPLRKTHLVRGADGRLVLTTALTDAR